MSDLPSASGYARPRRRFWRIVLTLFLIVGLMVAAGAGAMLVIYGQIAGQYDLTKLGQMRQRSTVLDVKGREIGKLHGENRVMVPLDKVAPSFVKALLAREDARFYDHGGVDYIGVARAIWRDIKERKAVQGASTITMQLARNSFDDLNAKTAHRKLVEVLLAKRIERDRTKDEIVELYVNRIFFGSGLYGIERASKAYFAKTAAELTLGESAMLAGIIRSPNRFSPFRNWEGATKERDQVLGRMVLKKFITPEEAEAAKKEDMVVAAIPVVHTQENYMMEAVRHDLDLVLSDEDIEDGGLVIHTTLDKDLQTAAEVSLEKRLREVEALRGYTHQTKAAFDAAWDQKSELSRVPYLQGAILAINNETGGILAVVGGRDYRQNRFDRALQGNRPIGSTIKPFIYAAAFMHGLLPGTYLEDSPMRPGELLDSDGYWSPENSDGKFLGWQPASVGLVRSRNAMTVRAGNLAGLDNVLELLRNAGLGEPEVRTPQIYIGNMGTTLKALTSGISMFANQGIRRRPFIINNIITAEGEQVYATPVLESEVLPSGIAQITKRLMERVMDEGTGAPARSEYGFKEKAGGKTGTTNDYKDAWFVGFTSQISCGVWVGLDTPATIIGGGYGGKLSLPIWTDVMKQALVLNYKPEAPKAEPMMAKVNLCRVTGLLATDGCAAQKLAYSDELPYELVPQAFCDQHGAGTLPREEEREERPKSFFGRLFKWMR
jgi:penicillin-binding protein 1A